MKCPHCNASVAPLQRGCDTCGFSATALHPCLGNQWVRLERITDSAHCLRLEENRQAEVILDDFERSFPQAFFAAYLGTIPKELRPTEVGFWLLNQGAFNTHSLHKRNDFGVVLVIDPHMRAASITLGYSIEACFSKPDLAKILREMAAHLTAGRFGKAIETACLGCARQLRKHAQSTRWTPDGTLNPGMGLEPLRGGHRPVSRARANLTHDSQP
ncbi:MAG TPA: hypothetical protein DDZ88_03075 [Verrucomicrobiales bacterium]|nr:hypothetical protein [Verrucomicrobiales bacterium]